MGNSGDDLKSFLWMLVEFIGICLLLAAVPFVVFLDTSVIGDQMSETSLTELLHNIGAFVATICFYRGAVLYPEQRACLVIGATLFAILSIRELDFLFDYIWHGFWVWPALVTLAVGIWVARRSPGTFRRPFLEYLKGRQATFVYLGFALLIIFTRLFGTGDLWEGVMKEAYDPRVKAAIQEGLELLSYTLIAYGSVASLRAGFAAPFMRS
ncbi:hypothetical protein [Sulfitobacter sp. JB4-11]|uniref:hypothetical protein n=1 Tax=Sulfitobacter rhodophyticola TaxID=3238304 RepID=UPI003514EB08